MHIRKSAVHFSFNKGLIDRAKALEDCPEGLEDRAGALEDCPEGLEDRAKALEDCPEGLEDRAKALEDFKRSELQAQRSSSEAIFHLQAQRSSIFKRSALTPHTHPTLDGRRSDRGTCTWFAF